MPSGDVHTLVNLSVLGLGVAVTSAIHGIHQPGILPFAAGYLIGTLLITPDLDLAGQVRVQAQRQWGVWGIIWWPLGRFLKHRGVTHTFIRGPTLLLGYLVLIALGLGWAAQMLLSAFGLPPRWAAGTLTQLPPSVLISLPGYLAAYWLHVYLDGYRPWQIKRW